jgi:prepilin-type N-terminal cleavage/methylation domain-containing protein
VKFLKSKGFTLIEIMIALVMFSMLMGIIMNAIHLTGKLRRHGESTSDDCLEPYITRVVIEADCRNFTEPLKGSGASKFERTVLDDNQTISFYSIIQSPINKRGISYVTYKAQDGKLVRELSNKEEPTETSELKFLKDLKSLAFRFADEPDENSARSEWPYKNRIPKYIVFDLTFKSEMDGHSSETTDSWLFSLGQVS